MIELKVGDKFVVKDTPLGGGVLIIKEICGNGKYKVLENEFTWHLHEHIDWESTKKLHEKNKTYDWHEAIKMAAEGIPMCTERLEEHMELYNNTLYWVLNDGTIIKPVRVHQSNMWHNNWITYIKQIDLTDDEKTILKNANHEYKWASRQLSGNLYLYHQKPFKGKDTWVCSTGGAENIKVFNHLFQQIKWEDEEPTLIKELLGNI